MEKKCPNAKYLDGIKIVDQKILYSCCPYLEEIKKLLISNVSNGITVKHITPLSTTDTSNEIEENKLKVISTSIIKLVVYM